MTPAEQAIANAIQCEMVLYAYRKNKDGVVVSFVVHPDDMPAELATAPIGARFVSALVHVGDDEMPVHKPAKERKSVSARVTPAKLLPDTAPAGAKRDWRDIPKPQQAGIRINEPTFAAYLREEHPVEWRETGDADACLKLICRIHSKREFVTDAKAGALWYQIDAAYQAWLARERVGV